MNVSLVMADKVGRKRLLLISVVVFTVASVLCATATSLTEMVLFRALQGVAPRFCGPKTVGHDGDALRLLRRAACAQPPRLILLDVDLPTLDGFQVLARLKRDPATANIPIVMLTHREHIDHVERAIALGASDYLFKDDGDRQLGALVAQLLLATEP